ncbi:hypothetical protein GF360_01415 [candidate division WWE3 bacterium]|nr:hypothetical protein [candidate division WWE3 bacterium]
MDHVAILRKSNLKKGDDLLGDILAGTKTIESRWYVNRVAPWDRVAKGDTVYFKQSGCNVTARAKVSKVLQFSDLTDTTIEYILQTYGRKIAPHTPPEEFIAWVKRQKKKRYCILIFLTDVEKVEPFSIDKSGYGSACAWLVTEDIEELKAC